jgi:hypothetical protein
MRSLRLLPLAILSAMCAWLLAAVPVLAAPLGQEEGGGTSTAMLGVLIAAGVLAVGGVLAFWISRTRQG